MKITIKFYHEENQMEMDLRVSSRKAMLSQVEQELLDISSFENGYIKLICENVLVSHSKADWGDLAFEIVATEPLAAMGVIEIDEYGTPSLQDLEDIARYGRLYIALSNHPMLSGNHKDIIEACELVKAA